MSPDRANWMLISPRTPTPLAMPSVEARSRLMSNPPKVIGGRAKAEVAGVDPASSMCSITPPR
ncbi:hypothetical protein SMICM304S_02663 [Streptomyces microflavus]